MSQEIYYLDEIYQLDSHFANNYYQEHHLEVVRKLEFLLFKCPDNKFYQHLKVQSWHRYFSFGQKKCIDEDYWKYNIDIINIMKKRGK